MASGATETLSHSEHHNPSGQSILEHKAITYHRLLTRLVLTMLDCLDATSMTSFSLD